jgi:3-oxoacyl-[acyl-carrier protein] reductase
MDLGIRGRKALLSGASRGLGKAAAIALARDGVDISILARTRETLERTAAEIRALGVKVTTVVGDVTTAEGRKAVLAACPEPDILINSADGSLPGEFRNYTRADWLAALDAMMLAPIEMMRATVDGMMARKFGRIVNISSRSAKIAQMENPLSNGSRAGLIGFVAGLSRQTVAHNVTINNILPGIFDTDAQKHHIDVLVRQTGKSFEQIWNERSAGNPAKRYGRAEEFGAYCAFLCSAQAGFITGQNLLIDGGSYPGTY